MVAGSSRCLDVKACPCLGCLLVQTACALAVPAACAVPCNSPRHLPASCLSAPNPPRWSAPPADPPRRLAPPAGPRQSPAPTVSLTRPNPAAPATIPIPPRRRRDVLDCGQNRRFHPDFATMKYISGLTWVSARHCQLERTGYGLSTDFGDGSHLGCLGC